MALSSKTQERTWNINGMTIAATLSNGDRVSFRHPNAEDFLWMIGQNQGGDSDNRLISRLCTGWSDRPAVSLAELQSKGFVKIRDLNWLRSQLGSLFVPPAEMEFTAIESDSGMIEFAIPEIEYLSVHREGDGYDLEFADRSDRAEKLNAQVDPAQRQAIAVYTKALRILAATAVSIDGRSVDGKTADERYTELLQRLTPKAVFYAVSVYSSFFI